MMDVARHFFDKGEVKHFIDDMVKYKFNLLHLHLTDDDGWRIEIKSLPLLTKIGAWRPEKIGTYFFFKLLSLRIQIIMGAILHKRRLKKL